MLCLHVVTVKDCICMLLALYIGMHNMDELRGFYIHKKQKVSVKYFR